MAGSSRTIARSGWSLFAFVALFSSSCELVLGAGDRKLDPTMSSGTGATSSNNVTANNSTGTGTTSTSSASSGTGGAPSGLTVELTPPLLSVSPGVQATEHVHIGRPTNLDNATFTMGLTGVPATVTDSPPTIGPNVNDVDLQITGNPDAMQGPIANVIVTLSGGGATGGQSFQIIIAGAPGTPDTSFNTTGTQTIGTFNAMAIAIDSQDRPVVAGGDTVPSKAVIARLVEDGSLDQSFNNGALVKLAVAGNSLRANGVAIVSGDRVAIAGEASATGNSALIARFNANGTPDSTFNSSGYILYNQSASTNDSANAITVLSTDEMLVAGQTTKGMPCALLLHVDTTGVVTKEAVSCVGGTSELLLGAGAPRVGRPCLRVR